MFRAKNMLMQPETGLVFSKWQRDERNKPKPKPADDEDIPEEDEEDESKKPLIENRMVQRECDIDQINREISFYSNIKKTLIDEFVRLLNVGSYLKVDSAGMTPDELCEAVLAKFKPNKNTPLRPVAKQIEEAGSFKDCLMAGIDTEDDKFALPRQFSVFRTVDCVAHFNGQVEQGTAEFAAEYANNIFVF